MGSRNPEWKPDQKKAQNLLRQMGADGVPVHQRIFGEGHWLRPGMIQFFGCRNVLVEGLTILDAPFWVVHPVYSQNVIVRGIRIDSHNANNDGVDPDSCVDVLIEDCHFNTGDDSVAINRPSPHPTSRTRSRPTPTAPSRSTPWGDGGWPTPAARPAPTMPPIELPTIDADTSPR